VRGDGVPRMVQLTDAARILGAGESRILKWLDGLLSIGLAVAAPVTGGATLGLFDPKNDLVRWLEQLRKASGDRLRGADRRTRGEVMTAAHTVLLVSAYFDTLAGFDRLTVDGSRRTPGDRWTVLFDQVPEAGERGIVHELLRASPPVPRPGIPRADFDAEARAFFAAPGQEVLRLLRAEAAWDERSESDQMAMEIFVSHELPARALARYHGYVIQLAGQSPEFLCWTLLNELQAAEKGANARLDDLARILDETRTGLAGLTEVLPQVAHPAGALRRWDELATGYAADLDQQIIAPGTHGAPAGLAIPTLGAAYVNHAFRAASYDRDRHRPHDDGWWEAIPVREEIQGFFAACLADPDATVRPLLLLGHPGSGKSVLSRVLAARLSDAGHPTVRVDLRRVPADAPIHRQVAEALSLVLHRSVDWADLADAAGDATPVILLDGLDELIQSSQASRSDYLEQVAEFQRAEAGRGRPVVAVVTSRTMVAHQARIPAGTTVVRLEPFDEPRIARWLDTWNAANAGFYAGAGLRPLARETVLRHPHLARQPLLLLMLALYDAGGNALQRERQCLADADLYERLLRSFARREVRKHHPSSTEDQVDRMVEQELEQLSIAALAMFNRDGQVVDEEDLDADLRALSGAAPSRRAGGPGRQLSNAQLLIGRFFFVHASHSTYQVAGEAPLRAYEFLHATFGEYLVARMAVKTALATYDSADHRSRAVTMVAAAPNDELLTALLSFQVLTMRAPIVDFVWHRLGQLDGPVREGLRALLVEAVAGCLYGYDAGRFSGYQPRDIDLTVRLAVRSANLVVLLVALDGEVEFAALFPGEVDPAGRWRRMASFWRATLDTKAWRSLVEALQVDPRWAPERVQLSTDGDPYYSWTRLVWELDFSNTLIGDPAVTGLTDATADFLAMDDIVLMPESGDSPSPAGVLAHLALGGPGYRWITPRVVGVRSQPFNDLVESCLTAAATIASDKRAPYLYMIFRQLEMGQATPPTELLSRACDLIKTSDSSPAKFQATVKFVRALAEIRYREPLSGPDTQQIARHATGLAMFLHFLEEADRLDFAAALAELGIPVPPESNLELEKVIEHPGAAWRAIGGDLSLVGRLLRGARGAASDDAAVAVLRVVDMLPARKLARLPWRELLTAVARTNRIDPALAGKVVTAWDTARKQRNGQQPGVRENVS